MLEMQKLQPEMRKLQQRAPRRPPEAQRRDDEALPGAQGQPAGLLLPAAAAVPGVHHHVPGAARPDREITCGATTVAEASGCRTRTAQVFTPTTSRQLSCTSRWSARPRCCRGASTSPQRPIAGDRRRRSARAWSTPCSSSRSAVLYFVQQQMVAARATVSPTMSADAAEADAVPAGGVRRLPGLLPHRPGHLLHGPGDLPHRAAVLHHAPLLPG